MTEQALVEAIAEAQRFILRAAAARIRIAKENGFCASSKETAAAKRASLDLSRALSALRKRGAM